MLMKAPKAKKPITVTFRLTPEQRKKIGDFAIDLMGIWGRRVSNTEAVQYMIENAKPPAKARDPKLGAAKQPLPPAITFRISRAQRQKVIDYALVLVGAWRRRVSNNEAVQHMVDTLKAPSKARDPQVGGSAQA